MYLFSDDVSPGGMPRNLSTASGLVESPSTQGFRRNQSDNVLDQRDLEPPVVEVKSTATVKFSVGGGDAPKSNNNAKPEVVVNMEENQPEKCKQCYSEKKIDVNINLFLRKFIGFRLF